MSEREVFWALMINGALSWVVSLMTILAIATVFQRSDWLLKYSLALLAASMSVVGMGMMIQGWSQIYAPFVSTCAAIMCKIATTLVMLWFMAAYFRYGRFCQLEGVTLRPKDVHVILSGIWNNKRKESVFDPPYAPSVESESAQEMKV